ncbi:MAG: phage major capsid protein [bacterium]|nr:phage major capsid protein [bacterium]
MAITYAMLQAVTHDLVMKELADGSFKSAAGFRKFYESREKLDGGNKISSPVIISGAEDDTTGGWYTGAESLSDSEKEDITRAEVDWKTGYETVLIAKTDILKNKGSKTQILNLLTSKVKIAGKRFDGRIARSVFGSSANAKELNGLGSIIAATGDYATLSVGDIKDENGADAWLAYVKNLAGALTEVSMQLTLGGATEGNDRPHWAVMKQNTYNEVWGLLKDHQRILADDSSFSGAGHDQKKVLMYNGIPHLIDSHMKAQSIYYINNDYTKLYVHQDEDLATQSFPFLEGSNAIKERVLFMGNLFCNNRNKNSELAGITVVA